MTISVVIATFNRARMLDECLASLAWQAFHDGDETIVVDNGSHDDTREVIERHRRSWPGRLITCAEPRPGKSIALGTALAAASGEILAFTDDDVDVGDGWLAAIRDAMGDGVTALVGGPVAPRWEASPPRWLRFERNGYGRLAAPLALLDYGDRAVPLGVRAALGANLAVRRDVVARLGGFAPRLGKLRGTLRSGEDHDLCMRVARAGLKATYWPAARVTHFVPAERMRVRYFLEWFFWSGITHASLDRHEQAAGRSVAGVPAYLARRFVTGVLGACAAAAVGDSTRAVDRAIDAAFAAGYASARWGLAPSGDRTAPLTPEEAA